MFNILLLILSVVVYAWIWQGLALANRRFVRDLAAQMFSTAIKRDPEKEFSYYPHLRGFGRRIFIMTLLCMPINIGGSIFTVLGNAQSEKNIYAILSLYQNAKEDAVSLVNLGGYQKAGGVAMTLLGASSYQEGQQTLLFAGFAGYQKAKSLAITMFGVALCQTSERSAIMGFGVAGYQYGTKISGAPVAFVFSQKTGEEHRAFALFSTLESKTKEDKKK